MVAAPNSGLLRQMEVFWYESEIYIHTDAEARALNASCDDTVTSWLGTTRTG
jgi:hypothetical protein